jgi:hypothetical protein
VGIIRLGGSIKVVLRTLLDTFGLLDNQVAAHMFATVLGQGLVQVLFGRDLDEGETSGAASCAVAHQFHV